MLKMKSCPVEYIKECLSFLYMTNNANVPSYQSGGTSWNKPDALNKTIQERTTTPAEILPYDIDSKAWAWDNTKLW